MKDGVMVLRINVSLLPNIVRNKAVYLLLFIIYFQGHVHEQSYKLL